MGVVKLKEKQNKTSKLPFCSGLVRGVTRTGNYSQHAGSMSETQNGGRRQLPSLFN